MIWNGLVFVKVMFLIGWPGLQFCPALTVNLIWPVIRLPTKSPDETLPEIVASVAFAPVPVVNVRV